MTRKTFQAVADLLRSIASKHASDVEALHALTDLADGMADMFAADNPRFDRARFLLACGTLSELVATSAGLVVKIETSGDAFAESGDQELSRILRTVAERVEHGETSGTVRDVNGNTCGSFDETF